VCGRYAIFIWFRRDFTPCHKILTKCFDLSDVSNILKEEENYDFLSRGEFNFGWDIELYWVPIKLVMENSLYKENTRFAIDKKLIYKL
jgi:hypothetical protein